MTKYRYATDVVFMAEEPFVYNDKECVGVSCFIEFQVINRDLKEIFFELEDNLDPYEHEDKVPLLLKRIQSFGFEWDIGVPSAYEEFVSIRNRFKNFAVILYI